MTKYFAFMIIFAMRLIIHPSHAQDNISAFDQPAEKPASVVSFSGTVSKDKVTLNWVVDENHEAEVFEIEKSKDGKHFTMTAIVFGTDKPARDSYQFYEKVGNQKLAYRIKVVNKNKQAEYSTVVEISPKA